MSGIAVVFRLDGESVAPGTIEGMLAAMQRRGPDRQGAWRHAMAGLGQVSLLTTPEARHGVQPWVHPSSGCVVVSDSRLDERRELARTLALDCPDIDRLCDGELLHAAWRRWGADCADQLRGDFAFAIWDPQARRLFCARDAMGVRPLHYHHVPGKLFAVATEAEALLSLPDIPDDFNEGRIADLLVHRLTAIDKTSTFFTAISRLPPAHTLTVEAGGLALREYWRPLQARPLSADAPDQAWIDGLRQRLAQAVARRVRADVPIGSMLSGGLDSSSVAALASLALAGSANPRLATFSAATTDPDCPETRAILAMASHFPFDSVRVLAGDATFDQAVDGFLRARQPFEALAYLIDAQYVAAAGRGVRVMLDGVDGDNLLSQGNYLQQLFAGGHWRRLWHETREYARFHGAVYRPGVFFRELLAKQLVPGWARPALRRLRLGPAARKAVAESGMEPGFADRIRLRDRLHQLDASIAAGKHFSADRSATSTICSPYTTEAIERYGRVAADRGIEPRHPFLDRDLIDFAAWIPRRLLLRDGFPKWVLRRAMADLLPPQVAWRRGKEHLGPGFNKVLLDRLRAMNVPEPGAVAARMAQYLRPGWQPPWPRPGPDSPDWENELRLRAFAAWLGRRLA